MGILTGILTGIFRRKFINFPVEDILVDKLQKMTTQLLNFMIHNEYVSSFDVMMNFEIRRI